MTPLFSLLSPAGPRARLSVLIFHRVLPEPDPIFPGEIDVPRFDAICRWVRQWFNVLPLDAAVSRLQRGTLPARAAAITFDDGYADNHDHALPLLQRHGLPATFFIASGFIDGGCMWNDGVIDAVRRCRTPHLELAGLADLPDERLAVDSVPAKRAAIARIIGAVKYLPVAQRLEIVATLRRRAGVDDRPGWMMTSEQLRAMRRAGMQIGAHTVTHPILARLDRATALDEMRRGRDFLESTLQERVGLFAYPNGRPGTDYSEESVAAAREAGFDAAFTTAWGAASQNTDMFQLPRFTPWDQGQARFGLRLAGNLWNARKAA